MSIGFYIIKYSSSITVYIYPYSSTELKITARTENRAKLLCRYSTCIFLRLSREVILCFWKSFLFPSTRTVVIGTRNWWYSHLYTVEVQYQLGDKYMFITKTKTSTQLKFIVLYTKYYFILWKIQFLTLLETTILH